MNPAIKTVMFWFVIAVSAILLFQVVHSPQKEQRIPEISYSQFMSEVEGGQVARVNIAGTRIEGQYREGKGAFRLVGPGNPGAYLDKLQAKGVEIWFKDSQSDSLPLQLLGTWAPLILLGALWFFMVRQMRQGKATSGGTGRAETPGKL